jgi:hypothetical protein
MERISMTSTFIAGQGGEVKARTARLCGQDAVAGGLQTLKKEW